MANSSKSEEDLEREAADWFTRLHSGEADSETRAGFEAWLHADRAHKAAYSEFEQVYRDLDFVSPEAGVDVDAYLDRGRSLTGAVFGFLKRPAGALASAAAALAVAALITTSLMGPGTQPPSDDAVVADTSPAIATEIAEIRTLTLEDGSTVTLGARSEIRTEFSSATRKVTLLEGEAFFDVVHDPARPFFVASQDTLVRVVGTQFDVKRGADIVHVSVLEGIVEVMKPADIPAIIETRDTGDIPKQVLTAGERVSAARRVALPEVRQIEQAPPGAWRQGRLAYEDASLAEIVADLNRYSERPIEIASSDVGDLRSTLAFEVEELDQVFEVLAAIHPVDISRRGSGPIVIERKR